MRYIYLILAFVITNCSNPCSCNLDENYYWKLQPKLVPNTDREDTTYNIDLDANYTYQEVEILTEILGEMGIVYFLTTENHIYVAKLSVSSYYKMSYINEKLQYKMNSINKRVN